MRGAWAHMEERYGSALEAAGGRSRSRRDSDNLVDMEWIVRPRNGPLER